MCELCDARARKRAVDAVEAFKPVPALPTNASSSLESGGILTPASESAECLAENEESLAASKARIAAEEERLYALLRGSTDASLPVLADLITWARSHGAIMHEDVEIYVSATHDVKLRVKPVPDDEALKQTIQASTDTASTLCDLANTTTSKLNSLHALAANSHILTSPLVTTLSCLNAHDVLPLFSGHLETAPRFPQTFIDTVTPKTLGITFLIQQYLLGPSSFWAPFIKSLPQPQLTHLSFGACKTYGKWGSFPLRFGMAALANRSSCFDLTREEQCECRNKGHDFCANLPRLPRNPYTPLAENEGMSDADLHEGIHGSRVLKWYDEYEATMSSFRNIYEYEADIPDGEWESHYATIQPVGELYDFHTDDSLMSPLWEWAAAIFASRALSSDLLPDSAFGELLDKPMKEGEMLTWRSKIRSEPFPVLFPLLDMANHSPMSQTEVLVNGADARRIGHMGGMFSGLFGQHQQQQPPRVFVEIGAKDVASVGLSNQADILAGEEILIDYRRKDYDSREPQVEECLLGMGYDRGKRWLAEGVRMQVLIGDSAR